MVFLRHPHTPFPCPDQSSADLIAVGGDLSLDRLRSAYRIGIFPWQDNPLTWWSPDPRAIFDLSQARPGRRLAAKMKKGVFRITYDQAFTEVMSQCAAKTEQRDTSWISPSFIEGYTALHRAGDAHSVEVWQADTLVGGIYGVSVGGMFAGESMFYRVPDASKVALFSLFAHLRERGYLLFDTQVLNPFTAKMGAMEIPRQAYLRRLASVRDLPVRFL